MITRARRAAVAAVILIALACPALGENALVGDFWSLSLPEGWSQLDASGLAVFADASSAVVATSPAGASVAVTCVPSEGLTPGIMNIFSSEYVSRAREAYAPDEISDVSTGLESRGRYEFFYMRFDIAGNDVRVYYGLSLERAVILVFANADDAARESILSTLLIN